MPPCVLFAGKPEQRDAYRRNITHAADAMGLTIKLVMDPDETRRDAVDYLVLAPNGPVQDFSGFSRLKAVLNLWAGVEALLALKPPDNLPLVRMVEDGLTLGMVDYVVGHVCRHHIEVDRYIGAAPIAEWEVDYPPLARDRGVGILGLGALGSACAEKLVGLGFKTSGWSRTQKSLPGINCLFGDHSLEELLSSSEILVLLLPFTENTYRLLDADRIARLPSGSCIVNAGRGQLIDHGALLEALDTGHIRHATMDVFDEEPLPPDHRYWTHPSVTVTPHIASVTRPETASRAIVAQIQRGEAGESFLNVVDRARGY